MNHRSLMAAGSLAVVVGMTVLAGVRVAGQSPTATPGAFKVPAATYTPPRTPWGDPDLQGIWDNRTSVPMERPTEAELAAGKRRQGDPAAAVSRLENVGGYNSFWGETHAQVADKRTSLIEDPPDGRIPPLTPEADEIREAYMTARGPIALDTGVEDRYGRLTTYRHWLDFDILGRCIAAQTPTGHIGYNSARYIMQSPGWVMIAIERLNTRLIALDGRPHLDGKNRSWQGDSRGHWEGNTLVVETINFTNKQSGGGVGSVIGPGIPFGNIRLVEHFVPVSADRIHYYATIEDAKTWTRPWTFMQPWDREPVVVDLATGKAQPYVMYEYACREGDEGIANSLKGTLVEDQRAAKKLPVEQTVASLIGASEAAVRAKLGDPAAVQGPSWEYWTTTTGLQLRVFFVGGKVVSVRPDDLAFDQVTKSR